MNCYAAVVVIPVLRHEFYRQLVGNLFAGVRGQIVKVLNFFWTIGTKKIILSDTEAQRLEHILSRRSLDFGDVTFWLFDKLFRIRRKITSEVIHQSSFG